MESSVKLVHIITDLSAGGAQSMLLNLLKQTRNLCVD